MPKGFSSFGGPCITYKTKYFANTAEIGSQNGKKIAVIIIVFILQADYPIRPFVILAIAFSVFSQVPVTVG